MSETENQVRKIVSSVAGIAEETEADADLYLDIGIASVHGLQLLAQLEERFQLRIPDDDFVEATSIAKLCAMIDKLLTEEERQGSPVA